MAECPFCKSKTIKIKTPYIDKHGDPIFTYCCLAQQKNDKYVEAHTSRYDGSKPSPEEVNRF
jgi:hypothetical protein